MVRRSSTWMAAGFLLLGLGLGICFDPFASRPVGAQEGGVLTDEQDRDARFEALAREVAAIQRQGNILKTVVQLASPSVVHIEAKKPNPASRNRMIEEAGSGTILKFGNKYFVLTNRHVVRGAETARIKVVLDDGREVRPLVVRDDADTDIAVMQIDAPRLVAARLGNSDQVEIGDFVLAMGSPFGLSRSVTYGIISAKGRRDLDLDDGVRYQDFMQTDAAINPGNSGGPLLNMLGEVIGMNTAIASNSGGNEGIGFSIPINMAIIIARQLSEQGSVERAFLGVNLDSKFGTEAAEQLGLPGLIGARVTGISPNSPASSADIQVGDVVLEFNHTDIEDDIHLVNIVSLTPVDKDVPVVLWRNGKKIEIKVRVGSRAALLKQGQLIPPAGSVPEQELSLGPNDPIWDVQGLGLAVVDINPRLSNTLRLGPNMRGVIIADVSPDGPSAGRVHRGEIIDLVNRRPIRHTQDLAKVLSQLSKERDLDLHIVPPQSGQLGPRTVVVPADSLVR